MARWVTFRWPDAFQGNPEDIGQQAGLVVRSDGDVWRATTSDQYYRQPAPQLLHIDAVITADNRADTKWRKRLDAWEGAPGLPASGLEPRVERVVQDLLHQGEDGDPTLEEFLEASGLLFLCLPDGEFPAWIQESLIATLLDALPDSRLCLIRFANAVHTRTAFVRGLFTAEHAVEWVAPGTPDPQFSAMSGLAGDGLQGSTRFLDPLVAAHAPWMLGASMSRLRSGIAVVLFGRMLPGRPIRQERDLCDALITSHLSVQPIIKFPATPTVDVQDAEIAVRWWVAALDRLVGHVLDPTLFSDPEGWYQPHQHAGHLLTFERFFASVVSLLAHTGRDEYSRRMHLFEALDLLEGLALGGYDATLDPSRLRDVLQRLHGRLPAPVARVLLPRCETAVAGVEEFRSAFHPGRIDDSGMLRVTGKAGQPQQIGLDKATHQYLRVVRNAGHGLRTELDDPLSLSLLAAHDGKIPAAVSDVPFVHLVRLLADPQSLADPLLRPQARRRPGPPTY